jgi:UDP-N-acetylglucosamine 2-epimerase (non-hydrolysing)/GDP/UDP-N,N'-diacetylbacillosamine 2-epimerase (hydrolysing)
MIVTERRADYSKFKPVLEEIKNSKKFSYILIVTGSHLLKKHGYTINEIKNDGFKISAKFSMYDKNSKNSEVEMVKSFGKSVIQLSKLVKKYDPDLILSGFDIGANLAVAIVGAHMNKVVAHIEGGEVSGTIDESIRHAITKFAHLHFTTNVDATTRLIKMGENPQFIFTVGNSSLDSIQKIPKISKKQICYKYNLNFKKPYIVVTMHTVTSEIDKIQNYMRNVVDAISELDVQAIIIRGNADAGSNKITKIVKSSKIKEYLSIPFSDYINILRNSSALVGNSSSGIMEAPFLGIPSVNIGTRQSGRLRSKSVIDVNYVKLNIKNAIKHAIYDKDFLKQIKTQKSLYGNGKTSKKIIKILEKINLNKIPIQKKMTY